MVINVLWHSLILAVCDREARRAGVRRGMRLRQAQALCPEAAVVEANPDREPPKNVAAPADAAFRNRGYARRPYRYQHHH